MKGCSRWWFLSLVILAGWCAPAPAQDPLRLVPAQADWVVKVENPRRLAEALYGHEVFQSWLKIEGVQELFDTTNFRRLLQLLNYYEKQLGVPGYELLDRLSGGGVVLATKFANPTGALVVIQGKDEALMQNFVKLTATIVEQELARTESKDKIEPRMFAGVAGYQVGKGCVAVAGATLLLASDPGVLEAALDLGEKKTQKNILELPSFKEAQPLLAKNGLAWTWLNLESARQIAGYKNGLEAAGMDPNNLVLFGGLVDLQMRSPFFVANFTQKGKGFGLEVRMPRGREGMNAKAVLYLPADDKGSLPLLQPSRALASISYYFDLKGFWENRDKILKPVQVKALNDFDANSGRYLGGTKISTLFQQAGPHQRIVVAQPLKSPYTIKPEQAIPAFALVQEIRDPAFGKSMNTVLRTAGILAAFTYNVKLVEEKHGEHTLIGYYFPEDKKVPGDIKNVRFNFSPCFAIVGDQLILSSTVELARDLVDALTQKAGPASPATTQIVLYSRGGAQALRDNQDQLLVQAILNQALPPASARKQLEAVIDLVERLGDLRFDVRYGQNDFRYGIHWQYGAGKGK